MHAEEKLKRFQKLLRTIRKHPIAGLILALSLEAWLAIPGEAMIAVAASSLVSRAGGALRLALGGMTGMLINDLALFGLSRIGRGVLVGWLGVHGWHWHLSAQVVMGAKFLPPLRSAAYLIYGLQGVPLLRFLEVSLLSSALWITIYAVLGKSFRHGIGSVMERLERRGRWTTGVEIGLTIAAIAVVWL